MRRKMPAIITITHGNPPCGNGFALPLPFAGLNFAINAMVTPPFARKCKNRNDEAH